MALLEERIETATAALAREVAEPPRRQPRGDQELGDSAQA
jgi:hypothetical protein